MKITELINLGKKTVKMFGEYIKEKNITPPLRLYIRYFTTDLEISEMSSSHQGSSEIIQRPDWTVIIYNFLEEKIKSMPEFKQLTHSITKRYKKDIKQSARDLEVFIRRLLYENLKERLSDDLLIEYASLFKSDLESAPIEHKHLHYLEGIFLKTDTVKINENVLIRKVRKEDVEFEKNIFDFQTPLSPYFYMPSSILEINMTVHDARECYEYENRIFTSLRLYKLGSIYPKEGILTKKTIIRLPGPIRGRSTKDHRILKKYTLEESEIESFVNFVNIIEHKLNFDGEDKKYRTLYISIERYNSALLEPIDIERKLMIAVMGLESLFTFEKDRGENAFKLSIRIAKLLGNLAFDTETVKKITEEAYSYRNKVVHGSYISIEKRKRINELLLHILNYLRIALIIFLLNCETGKNRILELIDKSMIDDSYNGKLKKLLETAIKESKGIIENKI